ncbi:unnamed protein product [Linum tenue]|uniref:Protein TIC 22-like, chloroplastic n=1 Tax=Linum tenue TaxID=586396 RepID=A0AAV0IJH1_9ROSI|nr:unnamed protein product [Linum tenue]
MSSSSDRRRNPTELVLRQAFTNLQHNCSAFLQNFAQLPLLNPNSHSSFQTHLQASLSHLQNHSKLAIDAAVSRFNQIPPSSSRNPLWARIPSDPVLLSNSTPAAATPPLTPQAIEERLAGVPVYALCNSRDEFVLVSGVSTGKSLGLMCFKKEDADALLHQMKSMDPEMRKDGSKVVAVALNKVFQLKVDGVSFRLIPESAQVKNALTEQEKAGLSDGGFPGVPVFQSRSLVLRSQTKSYRPVFFRKEDLEKSLYRASREQKKLNPLFRDGDIQVAVFEEVIKSMKENSGSTWNDVVFIPPGFDVSTNPTAEEQE